MTVEPYPRREPVRVGDIERGQAITQLQQAGLEGRLTAEELDERIALAQDELERLVADLPAQRPSARPETEVELRSSVGSIKRAGVWTVPRRLLVSSGTGSVRLDFSAARIEFPEIDIELSVGTGSTTIVLPAGASANINDVSTGTGGVRSRVPDTPTDAAPHFRISGHTGTGSIKVRYPRQHLFGR
jgi:uncharacterized small protein (DUF1192 family)